MLQRGGSAVDAAVAATLCIGAVNSHSSGIGGGGFMLVYNGSRAETIDFRETAPAAATERMFANFSDCDAGGGQGDTSMCPSRVGGLAVGVPGEMRGLFLAWQRHGRLPWSDVLAPVIALCHNGFEVTGSNAAAVLTNREFLERDPILNATFFRNGVPISAGEKLTRPALARTLQRIADDGDPDAVYTKDIADRIVGAVDNNSFRPGILRTSDLANYTPEIRSVTRSVFAGSTVFSAPPPASGGVLAMILNVLDLYNTTCAEGRDNLENHRIVEAFKFGYGYRSRLSDPCCASAEDAGRCSNASHCSTAAEILERMLSATFAAETRSKILDNQTKHDPEYYGAEFENEPGPGTTHVSVVGPDGDAVAITSTINTNFGAKIMTSDGIVLNNQMDDFSTPGFSNAFGYPPAPANFIRPRKRPLSSSAPVVITGRDGKVQLVAGASGGSKIITAVAQVVVNVFLFCQSARSAVDAPRIHHQLLPDHISGEHNFPVPVQQYLERLGHWWNYTASNGVCQAIIRGTVGPDELDPAKLYPASDISRKAGALADGF